MTILVAAEVKSSFVQIGHWQNPRQLLEMGDKIALEIALSHHCATCDERIRFVSRKLAERGVTLNWVYPTQDSAYIELDAPTDGRSSKEFLSGLLGLTVY